MATAPPPQAMQPPPQELFRTSEILFLHPGYNTLNILLRLPRVDQGSLAGAKTLVTGVLHGTALVACQIIANNAFETGRLAEDKGGQQPVGIPLDSVLTKDVYYFFVDDGPSLYPIVPSFKDWEFPHDRIPESWLSATFASPTSTSQSIGACSVSGFSLPTEGAHLVPKKELAWYMRNGMYRYGRELLTDINNGVNILRLRSDLHTIFDARMFVIVPMHSQFATSLLVEDAADFWPTYHNILVRHLHPRSTPYLFARFAWAILFRVKGFICCGVNRAVTQLQLSKENAASYETRELDGSKLFSEYGGGGSKDATLRKRGRSDMDDEYLSEAESSDGWSGDGFWGGHATRRQQHSSDETAPDMFPWPIPERDKADLVEAAARVVTSQKAGSQS